MISLGNLAVTSADKSGRKVKGGSHAGSKGRWDMGDGGGVQKGSQSQRNGGKPGQASAGAAQHRPRFQALKTRLMRGAGRRRAAGTFSGGGRRGRGPGGRRRRRGRTGSGWALARGRTARGWKEERGTLGEEVLPVTTEERCLARMSWRLDSAWSARPSASSSSRW